MSNVPTELRYASSHEWVRHDGDGVYTVGISDHAQELLGDIVFVEMPEIDETFAAGDEISMVESVKAASDIYAPISGVVVAVNEELDGQPELVNSDPYGDGWLFKIKADDQEEVEALHDAEGYQTSIDEDDE